MSGPVKITNGEVVNALGALARLSGKLPVRVSFELAKLDDKLGGYARPVEKTRKGIVEKYGIKMARGEEGTTIITADVKPAGDSKQAKAAASKKAEENLVAFRKEVTDLMELDVKDFLLPGITVPIKLPEKIAATCDKCHHNMDRPFEIESSVLVGLLKFVEI